MRKVNKNRNEVENSVEAYVCVCSCACACTCSCFLGIGSANNQIAPRNTAINPTSNNTANRQANIFGP